MKSTSQTILFILVIGSATAIILMVFEGYSGAVPTQRQAIHIFDSQNQMLSNPDGLITISEIKPNSMVHFFYPDPGRYKNRDPYEQFLLIRLPDFLGGTANNATAFRAYSAIDPSSHCLIKYWPEDGRARIEDSCSGNTYEPVSGHAIAIHGNPTLVSENLALPYLEISSDQDGFLYAEPPVWTEDQNGVVGIGRQVSESEIKLTNELIAATEKQIWDKMEGFQLPEMFSTGHRLDNIISDHESRQAMAYYLLPNSDKSYMIMSYEYCDCPQSKQFSAVEMTRPNSQTIELDSTFVVAYPNARDYSDNRNDKYTFIFYDNGFRITLFTQENLEKGLELVKELLDFWKYK